MGLSSSKPSDIKRLFNKWNDSINGPRHIQEAIYDELSSAIRTYDIPVASIKQLKIRCVAVMNALDNLDKPKAFAKSAAKITADDLYSDLIHNGGFQAKELLDRFTLVDASLLFGPNIHAMGASEYVKLYNNKNRVGETAPHLWREVIHFQIGRALVMIKEMKIYHKPMIYSKDTWNTITDMFLNIDYLFPKKIEVDDNLFALNNDKYAVVAGGCCTFACDNMSLIIIMIAIIIIGLILVIILISCSKTVKSQCYT